MLPRILICSSDSGNEAISLIKEQFKDSIEILRWNHQGFQLTQKSKKELLSYLEEIDLAIVIITNDELKAIRNNPSNIDIEACFLSIGLVIGLLSGKLGVGKLHIVKLDTDRNNDEWKEFADVEVGEIIYPTNVSDLKLAIQEFCEAVKSHINQLGSIPLQSAPNVTHQLPIPRSKKISEIEAIQEIQILNNNGDALLKKTMTFMVLDGVVTSREHEIFCDVNPANFAKLQLRAYDKNGDSLDIKLINDSPNRKRFKVTFKDNIVADDPYTYSYEYRWNTMLPEDEEYFILRNTAYDMFFNLTLPHQWDQTYIGGFERDNDGSNTLKNIILKKLRTIGIGSGYKQYQYELSGFELHNETIIKWKTSKI